MTAREVSFLFVTTPTSTRRKYGSKLIFHLLKDLKVPGLNLIGKLVPALLGLLSLQLNQSSELQALTAHLEMSYVTEGG